MLAAFGLDERQFTSVQAKWNEIPDAFQATPKIKLSLTQLAALEAFATSQNKSIDTVVTERS
ncbi:MAG TPA: hypothetical protein VGB45_15245 [Abditibacterium sp.]